MNDKTGLIQVKLPLALMALIESEANRLTLTRTAWLRLVILEKLGVTDANNPVVGE